MARLDGRMCDNHSAGVWRYKNRKVETWGAKYRIGQQAHSLGQFETQLAAMLAYDEAVNDLPQPWKHLPYFTEWGRKLVDRNPDLTIEQMIEHDRLRWDIEWDGYCYFIYENRGRGDTYFTRDGLLRVTRDEQEMLRECFVEDIYGDIPE
jgi:hypothetical protein